MGTLKASPEGINKISKAIKQIQKKKDLALDKGEWLDEASTFLPSVKNKNG